MPLPPFLNANESRAYPLVPLPPPLLLGDAPVTLPPSALVDFGCVVGLDAGFVDGVHSIRLHAVERVGDAFTFEFRCDAPGLAGLGLRFDRALADPEFACGEAEAGPAGGGPVQAREDALWEGFLATGSLADLAAVLPAGGTLLAGNPAPILEPALAQNLARGWVRTVNLANEDRTRVTPPAGCDPAPTPSDGPGPLVVNRAGMVGPLAVRPGFNCTVRQTARDNSLTIGAALAAGAGKPCDEVPLVDGEAPPAGSSLLTGGPTCAEVVGSINGVGGGAIELVPGRGVTIAPSPDDAHTLVVEFNLRGLATCPPPGT